MRRTKCTVYRGVGVVKSISGETSRQTGRWSKMYELVCTLSLFLVRNPCSLLCVEPRCVRAVRFATHLTYKYIRWKANPLLSHLVYLFSFLFFVREKIGSSQVPLVGNFGCVLFFICYSETGVINIIGGRRTVAYTLDVVSRWVFNRNCREILNFRDFLFSK